MKRILSCMLIFTLIISIGTSSFASRTDLPMIATVGEERTITIYKDIDSMISEVGDVNFVAGGISFGHTALNALFQNVVPGGSLVYFTTLTGWIYEGGLRFDRASGIKGFNIEYTYRYEFKYGDPTTLPRWKVVKTKMNAVR